ncbi:DUF5709 domain-containing protein [Streptomyces chumphonensis]|uniref:DUF5709 domain-containing protein n=1 Tax=Streptomyces chumphonensis TaxID=1214925 RepID=UPI003D741655
MTEPNDPGRHPEEEGIPDLQDGSPKARRAEDPQRMPVPGDRPVAAEKHGTTVAEQREGESLDDRLAQEVPDVGADGAAGPPDPEAGRLDDASLPGRPSGDHVVGRVGDEATPAAGLSAEESAVHVEPLDESDAPPPDPEENPADGQDRPPG